MCLRSTKERIHGYNDITIIWIVILANLLLFMLEVCFTNSSIANRIFVVNEIKKKWLKGLKFQELNVLSMVIIKIIFQEQWPYAKFKMKSLGLTIPFVMWDVWKKLYIVILMLSCGKTLEIGLVKKFLNVMGSYFDLDSWILLSGDCDSWSSYPSKSM